MDVLAELRPPAPPSTARAPHWRRRSTLVVKCKCYGPHRKVTSPEVQRFLGTVWAVHRASTALFITTAYFTPEARALGESQGIAMFDRTRLAHRMQSVHQEEMNRAA